MHEFSTIIRPEPVKDVPREASTGLVEACNAFAFDLWDRIRHQEGNLAVSPASISLALAMTWAGARGETADQMARVLHLEGREGIHEAAAALLRHWNNPDRTAYELRVVNRLFGEQSYHFEEKYLELVRQRYGAPVERVDFRNSPEPSRSRINAWIEAQTADRIRNLLSPGAVDSLTRLILTNAVYFLSSWIQPFQEDATRDAYFHSAAGSNLVRTMHQSGEFPYWEDSGKLQILEIPYRGDGLAMAILLPSGVLGIRALEESISTELLDRRLADLRAETVEVALPRFTIDPTESIGLAAILAAMGMPRAFDRSGADFTGIGDAPGLQDRLFINDVVHKPFVKVDEAGTEAAAATAVEVTATCAMDEVPSRPKQFRADHPFLFLIRDLLSRMILFVGRVTDPRA